MADHAREYFTAELSQITPCSDEEMKELVSVYQKKKKEEILNRMVEGNLFRVSETAALFETRKISYMDLIQEGNLAMVMFFQTLTSWDQEASGQLSQEIRKACQNYAESEKEAEKAGDELKTRLNVLDEVCVRLSEKFGREPTAEEVAEVMKMDPDDVRYLLQIALNAIKKEE